MFKKYKYYIISILIALAVGGLSALATRSNMNVFDEITKPPLTPPSAAFGIVWTILFVLMGISSAGVYEALKNDKSMLRVPLSLYAANLAVNFLWSIIFFNMRAFLFAFIWLLLLLAVVLAMIIQFYKVRPWTAYLQIPYFVWGLFALYLNIAIYVLN